MTVDKKELNIINRASLVSALTNLALSILKIVFGILGFSYALVTDGIHSISDILIDGLVVISARVARNAPNKILPYGYRRIETIGTIIISLIILAVGASILWDGIDHLLHHTVTQSPTLSVFVVAAISALANEWLYRYTLKKSNDINSAILKANAWHNRSDAMTSLLVLVGAFFAHLGWNQVDTIAAIIISLFIIKMGARYTWDNIRELVDSSADPELVDQLHQAIMAIDGVVSLHQLRTRKHADKILLDGHVQVSPRISVSEGHFIGTVVYAKIKELVPNLLDATIHIDAENDDYIYKNLQAVTRTSNREQIKHQLKQHSPALPGIDGLQDLTLHYLANKVEVELLLPLSVLDTLSKSEVHSLYEGCLNQLIDIESVAINFFRD